MGLTTSACVATWKHEPLRLTLPTTTPMEVAWIPLLH